VTSGPPTRPRLSKHFCKTLLSAVRFRPWWEFVKLTTAVGPRARARVLPCVPFPVYRYRSMGSVRRCEHSHRRVVPPPTSTECPQL